MPLIYSHLQNISAWNSQNKNSLNEFNMLLKRSRRKTRTNVASVGSVFNDTRKVKVLSLPETIKEKSTFRVKVFRRELVLLSTTNFRRSAFARNVDFSFIVSGSERTFIFRVS